MKCFPFRRSLLSVMYISIIFNIFKVKQKTGDSTSSWRAALKRAHPASWVQGRQNSVPWPPPFQTHTMQSTRGKFMSLQFAWQPAFKSPRSAALRFRASFAVLEPRALKERAAAKPQRTVSRWDVMGLSQQS